MSRGEYEITVEKLNGNPIGDLAIFGDYRVTVSGNGQEKHGFAYTRRGGRRKAERWAQNLVRELEKRPKDESYTYDADADREW